LKRRAKITLRKPDADDYDMSVRRGTWSVFKDIAFDEHLKRLDEYTKGKGFYEPTWIL